MIDIDFTLRFDKKDIMKIDKVNPISYISEMINDSGKIYYDVNGYIPGVSNYKYANKTINGIIDYASDLVAVKAVNKMKDVLDYNEINRRVNECSGLIKVISCCNESVGYSEFLKNVSNGANFVSSIIDMIDNPRDFKDAMKGAADSVLGGILSGTVGNIGSVFNNMQYISRVVVNNELENIINDKRWGDKIPNRPIMILSMYNTVTGDTYKSCHIADSFDTSYSANHENTEIAGRTNPIVAYNNGSSSFSISFPIIEDLLLRGTMKENIDVLKDLATPRYLANMIQYPKVRVSIGDEKFLTVVNDVSISRRADVVDNNGHSTMATANISFQVLGKSNGSLISSGNY